MLQIILAILYYGGAFANSVFFVCSAWFLLDSDKVSQKKILQMLMDIWVISIIILAVVYFARGGNIDGDMLIRQIFPTTYANNWYITCYLIFYPVHPFLNWIIKKMEQKTLLKATLVLLLLYVFANYFKNGLFYRTNLVLWITIYFAVAYMKYYLVELSNNLKINFMLLGLGFIGNLGIVLATNFLGLHFPLFSGKLLRWSTNSNPFLILMAVSLMNIARNIHFKHKGINYISSLSLLIYVIHDNLLLRTYYRPMLWQFVYRKFGYDHILAWTFVLVFVVLAFGLIASILYKHTIQKAVIGICHWLYPKLQKMYRKIEKGILSLH